MNDPRGGSAVRSISLPSADGRSSFTLELISGGRVALRVAKISVFFTYEEARQVSTAFMNLLTGVQP